MMFLRCVASFGLVALLGISLVQAVPMHAEKRLEISKRSGIVADIEDLADTIDVLNSQLASDPTNAAAVASAEDGIGQAHIAIGNIAGATQAAQSPDPNDCNTLENGLNEVFSGLNGVTSADPAVSANVRNALSLLQSALVEARGLCN